MKLAAAIARSLQADMQAELRDLERAVAAGTRSAGQSLKTELRRQVTSAALGQRLANSWRDRPYPTQSSTRRAWCTLLEHAAGLVNRRRREYGEPVDLFEQVAQRWTLTLGTKVSPAQVVLCLIDLKLARLARDPKHLDSQVDVAGYAAVLREVSR